MKRHYKQSQYLWRPCLVLGILLGACGVCIASGSSPPTDKPSPPDILDGGSSRSSASSSNGSQMTCTSNIKGLGVLPLAAAWSEKGNVTVVNQPLAQGSCVGYKITPAELADTPCGVESPDNYILVEFWQLQSGSSSSSNATAAAAAAVLGGPDTSAVRIFAARGTQPWLNIGLDGHQKVTPPIRDADTGLTPVGTFQDDAAMIYSRPAARVFFPTSSPMTDVGEPLEPDTWYITIANTPQESSTAPLPGYALRASCIQTDKPAAPLSASSKAAAAADDTTAGIPCPVAIPGGPQCSGRGVCKADSQPQVIDSSRFCDCKPGFGSFACQLELQPLPINAPLPTVVTVGPGEWGYWEVTLPGLVSVPGGPSRDAVAAAAVGLGSNLVGNEELLVTAERLDAQKGYGGNPLVFLKPFTTEDHQQPMLDALDNDVVSFSDLRGFQLQLNKHYVLQRDRVGPAGVGASAMPRRWYVAIYNSNATRLSQPVKIALNVQYRDLNRQSLVCPYNCNNNGRCIDPKMTSTLMPRALGTSDASIVTAVGPMQDRSPVDAGFMCVCNEGFAGLTCEGRMMNVTVGSVQPPAEVLQPGEWFFYIVTLDQGFNSQTQDLGIAWQLGEPGAPPSNYSSAYISFDQGPLPSRSLGDRRLVIPSRKSMTPYSKLIVRDNPPLPLQVPGGQLSPGGTYVVSIFNNDYVVREAFKYTLSFFVMSESATFMHPYMSILLGVTAAVILCLAMTLCKRVVMRYGLLPWRWRQRRQQLLDAANGQGGLGNSLSLVLMAQSQQSNRGVPPEIYQAFLCRPYALKDYQQRQHDLQQQQQPSSDVAAAGPDQQQQHRRHAHQQQQFAGQPTSPISTASRVSSGVNRYAASSDIEQQQQQGGRVVELATATSRPHPFHARLSQLSQTLSGHLSMQLSGAASLGSTHAAAAAGDGVTSTTGGVTSGPRSPTAGKAGTAAGDEADVAAVRDEDAPSCTVCLGEYVAEEMVRQLPCGHEFHQACIDQWMANHGTCPICRAPLWPGAYEPDEEESDNGSDSAARTPRQPASATPANIYVHHAMPAGGFMGGTATGAVGNVSSTISTPRAPADGLGGAAASAGAGVGAVGSPAAGAMFVPIGTNEQQPQRLLMAQLQNQQLQQHHHHHQQQQHWHPLQPMSPPAPTGTAVYSGEQAYQQQHHQQHITAAAYDAATATSWNIPAVQAVPDTWHQQYRQYLTRGTSSTGNT